MAELKERLKEIRKQNNLTQQQMADALKIKRSTYAYYETGKTNPKLETLKTIAKMFNTDVDTLLDFSQTDEAEKDMSALSSTETLAGLSTDDGFNQLSDFEQTVLLKVRIIDAKKKAQLAQFLKSL